MIHYFTSVSVPRIHAGLLSGYKILVHYNDKNQFQILYYTDAIVYTTPQCQVHSAMYNPAVQCILSTYPALV